MFRSARSNTDLRRKLKPQNRDWERPGEDGYVAETVFVGKDWRRYVRFHHIWEIWWPSCSGVVRMSMRHQGSCQIEALSRARPLDVNICRGMEQSLEFKLVYLINFLSVTCRGTFT